MAFSRGLIDQRKVDLGARPHSPIGNETFSLVGRTQVDPATMTGRVLNIVCMGQSTNNNAVNRTYSATNPTKLFNSYGNAIFQAQEPLLASDLVTPVGHQVMDLADALVTADAVDKVNIVLGSAGGSFAADHAPGGGVAGSGGDGGGTRSGVLSYRIGRSERILNAVGLASKPTVIIWQQGEWDTDATNTTQSNYAAALNAIIAECKRTGLLRAGRQMFINSCTRPELAGASSGARSAIRLAQASVVDGGLVKTGFDSDTIADSGRRDQTHYNATGAAAWAVGMKPFIDTYLSGVSW